VRATMFSPAANDLPCARWFAGYLHFRL